MDEGDAPIGTPTPAPQPMRLGLIFDVSLRILRRHWAVLLGVALLLTGPGALLTAATGIRVNTVASEIFPTLSQGVLDSAVTITNAQFDRLVGAVGLYVVATVVAGLLGTIAALGYSAIVGADYASRGFALGDALRLCLRRTMSALALIVVTSLAILVVVGIGVALMFLALTALPGSATARGGPGLFMALVIGVALVVVVVFLSVRWAIAIPVIAIEDRGWRAALSRSWHLSGDNAWRTFGVLVIGGLISAVAGTLISQLLAILLVDLLATSLGLDQTIAEALSIAVGSVLVSPIGAVMIGVLYFDLRARRDPPPNEPLLE